MPTQSKPLLINLDADTKRRIKLMAEARYTSPHALIRKAICQYVERESFRRDTLEALQEYQETGRHGTAQDVDRWLASWGTDDKGTPPAYDK